ncbi:MAG: dimethylsulfonioproprionate lyase family protein [Rhodobacterales bacterium]|nr:dimethylsulfonioproprionate lyase family protein [Rhodobacterales bacterium]
MTDTLILLHTPLGQPGSGRVRYGAAMALWREGAISAEVLEVYRITSAHDARDPMEALRDRGLPLPPLPPERDPVLALYAVARDYLLKLDHAGASEVRAGLPADPGPQHNLARRPNAVVDRWLATALSDLSATLPDLSIAIATAAPQLAWVTYDAYPRDQIGDAFAAGHAFASLMGGDAPFAADDFDLGLFLIAPHVLYRDHCHAAPELYAPLTGPHGWRFGPGRPLITKPAHQPVWNPPHQPHLTRVGAVPFLGLFVWTRDVNEPAQVIPADDWATLEEVASV